jgi:hypothetical protein
MFEECSSVKVKESESVPLSPIKSGYISLNIRDT